MTRDLMIGELKKVKPFYNYDRYRDDQIFRMYQRYVIDKTSQGDVVTQQETPVNTPIEKSIEDYEKEYEDQVGYKTCDICGARLDTVGTCPECLRGEEGMIDPREPKKFENLDESKMNPYERTAKRVLAYSKKDPERILLYDNMVEYLDELSMEGVFDIPKSAPGFECEDADNVTEEEALFYFEQVLANTDLENKLHELSKTGGNGHSGELEEDFEVEEHEEDFETDIDNIDDDYSDSVTEDGECVICGDIIERYGNNAEPVAKGFCCDKCNREKVIPARLRMYLDK